MSVKVRNLTEYHGISKVIPEFSSSYKTLVLQGSIMPDPKEPIDTIYKFICEPTTFKSKIKLTPLGTSINGQCLSGTKINFSGSLKLFVHYFNNLSNSMGILEDSHTIMGYIISPNILLENSPFNIQCYIHDMNILKISSTKLLYSIFITINAES